MAREKGCLFRSIMRCKKKEKDISWPVVRDKTAARHVNLESIRSGRAESTVYNTSSLYNIRGKRRRESHTSAKESYMHQQQQQQRSLSHGRWSSLYLRARSNFFFLFTFFTFGHPAQNYLDIGPGPYLN